MSVKVIASLVGIGAAIFSAAYTLVRLRSDCGNTPILECVLQAAGLSKPDAATAEQRKMIDDTRAAEARYKQQLEEMKRRAEIAEANRKAAEERGRAEEARRNAEDRERNAREAARLRVAEEEQARKLAAAKKTLPAHKFWESGSGVIIEYRQVEGSVVLYLVKPSAAMAARGATPGARMFIGYYGGTGNEVKGTSIQFGRPGCTVSVPNSTVMISPNQIVEKAPQGPAGCGYDFTHSYTTAYTPATSR